MPLRVTFSEIGNGVEEYPESWNVVDEFDDAYVWGFASKSDAMLAMEALEKIGIDWESSRDERDRQWRELGGRPAMFKAACENLRW